MYAFHTKFLVPKRNVSLLTSVRFRIYNEVLYPYIYIYIYIYIHTHTHTLHVVSLYVRFYRTVIHYKMKKVKVKVHPCTGTEALYRPYGTWGKYRYNSTLS